MWQGHEVAVDVPLLIDPHMRSDLLFAERFTAENLLDQLPGFLEELIEALENKVEGRGAKACGDTATTGPLTRRTMWVEITSVEVAHTETSASLLEFDIRVQVVVDADYSGSWVGYDDVGDNAEGQVDTHLIGSFAFTLVGKWQDSYDLIDSLLEDETEIEARTA